MVAHFSYSGMMLASVFEEIVGFMVRVVILLQCASTRRNKISTIKPKVNEK